MSLGIIAHLTFVPVVLHVEILRESSRFRKRGQLPSWRSFDSVV
jgi:hypothetical protein